MAANSPTATQYTTNAHRKHKHKHKHNTCTRNITWWSAHLHVRQLPLCEELVSFDAILVL